MKINLGKVKELFAKKRPEKWDSIPDIELYMDQVLSYMKRQHLGFELDETLSSSMVNNYVKQELMPRANGKKYNRNHIAYLTAICLFKQVVSVSDTKILLDKQLETDSISNFYEKYMKILDENLINLDNLLSESSSESEIIDLSLRLAISSYTQKLACASLIETLKEVEN